MIRIDFKENIRKVLKDHKCKSNFQTEYGEDLAEYIPGLYRLLDLYKDDGSNVMDKIIISKDSLKKLCNDMVPFSFNYISDINYTELNLISFRLIGCYGNYTLIAKLLLNKEIINEQIYDVVINKSSLRPGIYLLLINPDLGLIIHWPEIGCYEENASSQRKKNMINLHRYLTKLTDHQLCLMSDKDLESFDWNLNNSDVGSDGDDDACYEFEVKKSQDEDEDFEASLGFKKTQYRFQERVQRQSFGLVKISQRNINYTIIEGKDTRFEKHVLNEENIVIMGEKYSVLEVISNTKLKIAGDLNQISGLDKWMEFRIEPKAKSNGLVDAYGLMFEKYPAENCIDPEQNRSLSLKIVLDVEKDDNEIEKNREKFEEYITEMFEDLKRSTKKPTSTLKKFSTSVVPFQEFDIENAKFQKKFPSEYKLGEWIIQLCCLIPIQIAVARNNLFQPLRDGLSSNEIDQAELDDSYGHHVDSIAKNISFGWYEGILKYFGDKKVKVVSSMGEKSCGKQFMLNHLVGTTFDGSAMRCTEGIWMSLVNTREYVYVALVFEGLKPLERTPQEDMFLTLFNAVVSNLILFKNQFALNRDMSAMFQRFQNGAMLFEADSKIFQAKLCIIIRDVPKTDKNEIVEEFKLKFSQLVSEESENNFISRMYKGGLDIIPWPMFNDTAWFKTLSNVTEKLDKQKEKYENSKTFLQNTKVIMAKLKICDWGSLDENLIQIRVATLKRLLPTAVSYGLEQKDSDSIKQLMNCDSGEPIGDPVVSLSNILHDFKDSTEIIPDSDILLYDEYWSFEQLSEDLRSYLEDIVQPRKESSDDSKWFANFSRFFKYIIERRVTRVQNWYTQNTAKFPQDNNDIVNGKYIMEQELNKLTLFWTLCGLTCRQCGLKCVKNHDHKEGHDCLTDHKCHFNCQFKAHNSRLIPKCSHSAGHEGKHACNKLSHLCGKQCNLINKRNCQKVCSREIEHDGEHLCQSKRHYCGKDCSLSTYTQKGDYRCSNECVISYEEEHDLHRCEYGTCPIRCSISDCNKKCQSDDHFHSYSELQVDHFCGNEHQCRELCEDDGICKVVIEPRKQEETYESLFQETSITFTKYIQIGKRLPCSKKIPLNKFEHIGRHTHRENGFHYCDAKCQFCEYFCTSHYGHEQIHDTRHGNTTQTKFTGENNEFEYAGLKVGDQGTFVLCNLHCKDAARHRHIDYCQNVDNCKLGQDIQHINEKVQPNPDKPKDFISHKLFWERTGFKDPYSAQEQEEFAKCDRECSDEKYHNKVSHLCGEQCNLVDKRNCQEVCSKEIGHDDEHLCQSKRHYCEKDCSLSTHTQKGDYRCLNKCIISYDEEHDLHRCEYETCPIRCPIPDCNEKCQNDDHFHSYSESQVDHFCGNEHQCRELCEDDGICKVVTEPRNQEGTTFTKYIQIWERLPCSKKIPSNKFEHIGRHTHEEYGFHYCDAKCQFCEYFCMLPYGHMQIHDARHGNMTQTEFIGEYNEFKYAGHKLKVGNNQRTFVLCNLYCKDAGRHRHIDYCQNVDNCKSGQDIQHINEKIQPNPDKPKDFISHKLFWERTGFRDPYSAKEQREFAKCDHECPDEIHHKSQGSSALPLALPPTKSFCESQLFHAPHNPSSNPPNNYGHVSLDGHHFNCENHGSP